jgi:hypothetical protein
VTPGRDRPARLQLKRPTGVTGGLRSRFRRIGLLNGQDVLVSRRRGATQGPPEQPLTQPLTPEQQELVDLLASKYIELGVWPRWLWLRRHLGRGAAQGEELLRSLPVAGERGLFAGLDYGLAWFSESGSTIRFQDHHEVGLTIVGLARSNNVAAQALTNEYLEVLALAVERCASFEPPGVADLIRPRLSQEDVEDLGQRTSTLRSFPTYQLLRREPPFWSSSSGAGGEDGRWWFELRDTVIERYALARSAAAYAVAVSAHLGEVNAERLVLQGAPPEPGQPRPVAARLWAGVRSNTWDALSSTYRAVVGVLALAAASGVLGWLRHLWLE